MAPGGEAELEEVDGQLAQGRRGQLQDEEAEGLAGYEQAAGPRPFHSNAVGQFWQEAVSPPFYQNP